LNRVLPVAAVELGDPFAVGVEVEGRVIARCTG
jgi:hypothetical protein